MPDNLSGHLTANPGCRITASADLYDFIAQGTAWRATQTVRFVYSNLGFALLGEALAARAGVPYAGLIAHRIAGPARAARHRVLLSEEQQARCDSGYGVRHEPRASMGTGRASAGGRDLSRRPATC